MSELSEEGSINVNKLKKNDIESHSAEISICTKAKNSEDSSKNTYQDKIHKNNDTNKQIDSSNCKECPETNGSETEMSPTMSNKSLEDSSEEGASNSLGDKIDDKKAKNDREDSLETLNDTEKKEEEKNCQPKDDCDQESSETIDNASSKSDVEDEKELDSGCSIKESLKVATTTDKVEVATTIDKVEVETTTDKVVVATTIDKVKVATTTDNVEVETTTDKVKVATTKDKVDTDASDENDKGKVPVSQTVTVPSVTSSEKIPNVNGGKGKVCETSESSNDSETIETVKKLTDASEVNASCENSLEINSSLAEMMDVDSNSTNSNNAAVSSKKRSAEDSSSKIKLRSFASLCDSDEKDDDNQKSDKFNASTCPEASGVSVGDIVQHSNIVEHDESGVLHLKISDVVGKEECITGILEDDTLSSLQITSVVSLTEPISPAGLQEGNECQLKIASVGSVSDSSISDRLEKDKKIQIVILYKNRLVVATTCLACRKQCVCLYKILYLPPKPYIKFPYLCSDKCKENFMKILPANHKIEKPSRFFDRQCSMCDNVLVNKDVVHWQTREFCNKLCLADHIGEVARHCYECKTAVKVLFMGKYCVRFGSEIHQFCSNHCLESYKMKVESCSYCQKNLEKVTSVENESLKKYCGLMCLRRAQREDIGQVNYAEQNNCTVCQKSKINQYEFLNNNESVLLCSNPCLSVYKYVNQAKAVNCCMCSRFVNAEDFPDYFYTSNQLRVFCSESCLSVFIITARRVVSCEYCKVKKYNFDMIHKGSADVYYCSICCLNLTDSDRGRQALEPVPMDASGQPKAAEDQEPILKICQLCNKNLPAQFHMVMSDSTLRSFCSYNCACKFKSSFGYQVSGINIPLEKGDRLETIISTEKGAQANSQSVKKSTGKSTAASKVDFQALANILKEFEPPEMANKWTSCAPYTRTMAIQSTPQMCNKGVQTDEDGTPPFVPVPFPTFVPTPMMMYSSNVPIPIILPVPIPVPVFIPTTEKTTQDILKRMNKIQNEIPDDPMQAELLLLAKGQEAEMQQELESQITEEDLQTPQMLLEEPDEILTFADNDEDLSQLDQSIFKFMCGENNQTKRDKKKRHSSDDDMPDAKRQKLDGSSDETLNAAYGLSVWVDWVRKKNADLKAKMNNRLISEDLVQLNSEAINECLSMFLLDLEETTDRDYEIDTIFYLLLGIQKVMFERGSTFCIFLEDRFEKFGSTFDEMITRYLKRKFSLDIAGFQMLSGSRITEDMLWQCRQLGAHTPYVLLNTLFYFSTKCFKLRSVEDHMALSFSQVIKQWRRACLVEGSYTRTTLLKYFPRQAQFDKTELEMHENRVDPLKCPVKLYEFYLSKCPESVRSQQGLYYVYPETCCMPDSPVWFSVGGLNSLTVERMMHRVLLVKEIQEALYH